MFTEASYQLAKTEAGREALAQRSGCSPRERQVLILCDGRKTWGDFVALLGQPVLPVLASLQHKGFVLSVTPMLARLTEFSDTGTWLAAPGAEPAARARGQSARSDEAGRAAEAGPARPQARGSRSLAASKMYLVDVFRKQRSAAAHSHLLLLQGAADGDALVQAMLPALAFLLSESGASYASRVLTHVMASLPEAQLGAFCDGALALGLTQQMAEA